MTASQLFSDPIALAHMVGIYVSAGIVISFMLYEFFSFVRFLIRMWREKGGNRPGAA